MIGNRRDFIRGGVALSTLTASQASAQATSTPWVGFIHSTHLDEKWLDAFCKGLRVQKWEGDPSTNIQSGMSRVGIHIFEAGSKYRASDLSNLATAISNINSELESQLKFIVAGGGMVSGLSTIGITIPCLTVLGRNYNFNLQKVGGYYIDPIDSTGKNINLNSKIAYLNNPQTYNIPYSAMCLLYNSNSWMGSKEKIEWDNQLNSLGVANPLTQDAVDFGSGDNQSIDLSGAIMNAVRSLHAKAIVVSGDPHFTAKRHRIIHAAGTQVVMCYPFQDYRADIPASVSNNYYMAYGPLLADVYTKVGDLAGQLLTTPNMSLSLAAVASQYYGK
jgi:hypothetical protein